MLDSKWYAVKVMSGQEAQFKLHLENALEMSGNKSLLEKILIPTEKVYEIRRGKKKVKDKKMLPGYVFVAADLANKQIEHMLRSTPGFLGFLGMRGWGSSQAPVAIRDNEIERLLRVEEEIKSEIKASNSFAKGETIKVTGGPFNGFSGKVQEIAEERQKLTVVVKIFERDTPIELSYTQAEKII